MSLCLRPIHVLRIPWEGPQSYVGLSGYGTLYSCKVNKPLTKIQTLIRSSAGWKHCCMRRASALAAVYSLTTNFHRTELNQIGRFGFA